jgi:hypothetical protein
MAITAAGAVYRQPPIQHDGPEYPAKPEETAMHALAFAVVAVALGTPFLVPLLWGRIEKV